MGGDSSSITIQYGVNGRGKTRIKGTGKIFVTYPMQIMILLLRKIDITVNPNVVYLDLLINPMDVDNTGRRTALDIQQYAFSIAVLKNQLKFISIENEFENHSNIEVTQTNIDSNIDFFDYNHFANIDFTHIDYTDNMNFHDLTGTRENVVDFNAYHANIGSSEAEHRSYYSNITYESDMTHLMSNVNEHNVLDYVDVFTFTWNQANDPNRSNITGYIGQRLLTMKFAINNPDVLSNDYTFENKHIFHGDGSAVLIDPENPTNVYTVLEYPTNLFGEGIHICV